MARNYAVLVGSRRVLYFLTTAGVLLELLGLLNSSLVFGKYGLASGFSIEFWVGLGCLVPAFLVSLYQRTRHFAVLQLIFILFGYWLAPILLGASPPGMPHTLSFYGNVNFLLDTGHISLAQPQLWYFNWPGFWVFMSIFENVTGVHNSIILIDLAPFAMEIAFLPILLAFVKTISGDMRIGFLAVAIVALGNWEQQNALLPQNFGYLLFLTSLVLVARGINIGQKHWADEVLTTVVFSATLISHFYTSLVVLVVAFTVFLYRRSAVPGRLLLVFGIIVSVWTVYFTYNFVQSYLPVFLTLESFFAILNAVVIAHTSSPGPQGYVSLLRIGFVASIAVLGMLGLLWSRLNRWPAQSAVSILSIGVLLPGAFAFSSGVTGGVVLRVYTFLLIPFSLFVSYLFIKLAFRETFQETKPSTLRHQVPRLFAVGLAVVLISAMVLGHVVVQEGNQAVDYVPQGYLTGLAYFGSYTEGGVVWQTAPGYLRDLPPFGVYDNEQSYTQTGYLAITNETVAQGLGRYANGSPLFVPLTSQDLALWTYIGQPGVYSEMNRVLAQSPALDKGFSNGDVEIYLTS